MSHQPDQSGFMTINHAELYYESWGDGPPLVFVHAGIADSRLWDEQINRFATDYRVIRYDMRGYGQTQPVNGEFAHYQDLQSLLDHLNIRQAHLVGCSMGAGVVCDLALANPDRVRSLVLVGGVPNGWDWGDDAAFPPLWDEAVAAFEAGDFEHVAELYVCIWVDGREREPHEVDMALRNKVREMSFIALKNKAKKLGTEKALEPHAADRLGELRVPMLVINGRLDDPDFMAAADRLVVQVENCKSVIIDGTAHVPSMEKPDEFNRHLHDFLQSISKV